MFCYDLGQTGRINRMTLWITNLIGLVVDAVCQWVGPHANIEVSITEPLHCLLHIGDSPQSNLNPGEERETLTQSSASLVSGTL